jgi:5-formyltetrahydrofolate cyclo-ligase
MTSKSELRLYLRKIRQEFVKQQNIQKKFDARLHYVSHLLKPGLMLAGYKKFGTEVSADGILEAAHALDVKTALPFIGARDAPMCFKCWQSGEALIKSPYGFLQPAADAPDSTPDIILVPLVGFDRNMNRLGQGAGHYDRLFILFSNALRIGLAWSCQEIKDIPTDPWDIPLDAILTEKEWIRPTNSRIEA